MFRSVKGGMLIAQKALLVVTRWILKYYKIFYESRICAKYFCDGKQMCRFQYSLLRILRTQSFYHTLLPTPFPYITDVPALPIGTISLH